MRSEYINPLVVCDCESRVMWFAEDENGTILAVGKVTYAINLSEIAEKREVTTKALNLFASNNIIDYTSNENYSEFSMLDGSCVNVATNLGAVLDSCLTAEKSVLVLTEDYLIKLGTDGSCQVIVLASKSGHNDRLVCSSNYVVMFHYGFTVCSLANMIEMHTMINLACEHAALEDAETILVADLKSNIYRINLRERHVELLQSIDGDITFLLATNNVYVVIYVADAITCGMTFNNNKSICKNNIFASPYCEAFCFIQSHGVIAIGAIDGSIALWDILNNQVSTLTIPDNSRIVALHWSDMRGELFIGTRQGIVYKWLLSIR